MKSPSFFLHGNIPGQWNMMKFSAEKLLVNVAGTTIARFSNYPHCSFRGFKKLTAGRRGCQQQIDWKRVVLKNLDRNRKDLRLRTERFLNKYSPQKLGIFHGRCWKSGQVRVFFFWRRPTRSLQQTGQIQTHNYIQIRICIYHIYMYTYIGFDTHISPLTKCISLHFYTTSKNNSPNPQTKIKDIAEG